MSKMHKRLVALKNRFNHKVLYGIAAGSTALASITPAWATPATAEDIYDAVDLSSVSGKVIAVGLILVGIMLVSVAISIAIKLGKKAPRAV